MAEQVFLHDGSFEGLLTAVALAVKAKESVKGVYARENYVPSLFVKTRTVARDREQAWRLFHYLSQLSVKAPRLAIQAFLSEEQKIGCYLYDFVRISLTRGRKVLQLHANDSVRGLHTLARKVDFEADRLNGMLRFRILADGLLYGPFTADHNVIGYCAGHFRTRFANRKWILHDLGRNFALYWDTNLLQPVEIDAEMSEHLRRFGELPPSQLTDAERYYQQLWRIFHATIANPDRENKVLQGHFMPRRYWHFLVETKD